MNRQCFVLLTLALSFCTMSLQADSTNSGVIIASIGEKGAAAEAGMKVGDILKTWEVRVNRAEPIRGQITSPWMFIAMEQEYAGGFTVEVSGHRHGEQVTFSVRPPGEWDLVVHPILPEAEQLKLQQGLEMINAHAYQEGIQLFRELACTKGMDVKRSTWFLLRASLELEKAGVYQEAATVLEEALSGVGEDEVAYQIYFQLARVLIQKGAPEDAVVHAKQAVVLRSERESESGMGLVRVQILLVKAQLQLMRIDAAEKILVEAHELCLRVAPKSLVMVSVLNALGTVAIRRGQLDASKKYYTQTWDLIESLDPISRHAGVVAHNLGAIILSLGDLDLADVWLERALALRKAVVPDSLEVADTLVALGIVAFRRGQTAVLEEYALQAVEIQQRHAPGSQSEAFGLAILGAAAWERGDLSRAEQSFIGVLEIRERLSPGSAMSAIPLNNLGAVAHERGDYAKAESYYRRSLEIQRQMAPGSLDEAICLHNLGAILMVRKDFNASESYMLQAIAIREEKVPDTVYCAQSYINLAGLYQDFGRKTEAEILMRKALACWETVGPDSPDVALALGNLANWKIQEGDLDGAEPLIAKSLAIREKSAPGSAANALALQSMGMLMGKRGQVELAEKYYRQSLNMFKISGVATAARAETWNLLGSLLRDVCDVEGALDAYYQAIDDLEGVVGRLGGSEDAHSTFRAEHHDMYQNLIDLLVEVGQGARAFDLFERSKARGFLNMLEQRDLLFVNDISEELDRKRHIVRAEVERITVELSQVSADESVQRAALQKSLQLSYVKFKEIQDLIRAKAPRLAALTAPEPLNLDRSRMVLDEGTVALCYSVGPIRTQLFVIGPGTGDFRVITLKIGEELLRRKVRRLRNAAMDDASGRSTINRISSDLSHLLLASAGKEILRAKRILLVPDGPLHLLPFGMLSSPDGEGYLIQSKPIHRASSVTVFGELKADRRKRSKQRLAGFGAPQYSEKDDSESVELLAAYTRGEPLSPLPWSRDEVSNLRNLFPESSIWLGTEATEERVRGVGRSANVLHFACHALVDEHRPLESALILAIPEKPGEGKNNGFLQAWEVFESVRLDADLVVLSACRTALGRELAGEGIIGLTRAFQFAGARSVLASLWPVADRSTAELMRRFYEHLAGGATTDEALRQAQLELASGPVRLPGGEMLDATHPYFWAAFQLSGDWQ